MGIGILMEEMRLGLSPAGLLAGYLERIEADTTRSVIEVNPDAQAEASALGPSDEGGRLHGIPILVKDNIDTAGQMATGAGSLSLAGNITGRDAPIVQRLRAEGAIVLGKANMSEFANYMVDYRSSRPMPNGYSSRGGQVLSLYPGQDPSGSSTGSAVGVAAGLAPAALGTETSGSIVAPSQQAGIVGLKPTAGLLPSGGIIPISSTLDTAGPMTSCVADAALLLEVMAGILLDRPPVHSLRIGILEDGRDANADWLLVNNALAEAMRTQMGLSTTHISDGGLCADEAISFIFTIMRHEFKRDMNAYLHACTSPHIPRSLLEIIQFNEANPEAMLYGQDNLVAANNADHNAPEYVKALEQRISLQQALLGLFADSDVLFLPSGYYGLAAATGFPSLTLPTGTTPKGMPVGCCIMAKPGGEASIISLAAELEAFCGK